MIFRWPGCPGAVVSFADPRASWGKPTGGQWYALNFVMGRSYVKMGQLKCLENVTCAKEGTENKCTEILSAFHGISRTSQLSLR